MTCRSCGGNLFRLERRAGVCVRCAPDPRRGFAGWPIAKRRAVAGHGGTRAHHLKRAHEWTAAEAQAAGRKSWIVRRERAA